MKKTVIYKSDLNADYTSKKIKEKDEVSVIDLISRGECSSFEEFKASEEAKNFILKNEDGVDLTFSEFVDIEENQEKILQEAYCLDEMEFDNFPDTLRDHYFFILADLGTWQGRRSSSKIIKNWFLRVDGFYLHSSFKNNIKIIFLLICIDIFTLHVIITLFRQYYL